MRENVSPIVIALGQFSSHHRCAQQRACPRACSSVEKDWRYPDFSDLPLKSTVGRRAIVADPRNRQLLSGAEESMFKEFCCVFIGSVAISISRMARPQYLVFTRRF